MQTIGDLYEAFLFNETPLDSLPYFYTSIPKTYSDSIKYALSSPPFHLDEEKLSLTKKILRDYHQRLGLLTAKVEENIDSLHNGVVLAGQQSTIFGGSGIIANKIVTCITLSELSKAKGNFLVPVFFVNNHDSIQPELTTIHLPNNQSSASKAITLGNIVEGISADAVRLNDSSWLQSSISVIRNIFSEFKGSLEKDKQSLFQEMFEHILTFLQETYRTAQTLGEWSALIWGIQANIIHDWGLVLVPSDHPELNKLMVSGFSPFIEKRTEYIEEFNSATKKILDLGLRPTTAAKEEDYSPFFYVCPNDHYRIKLSSTEDDNYVHLYGKCPIDEKEYSFSLSKKHPDFSSLSAYLSPRLDTNQVHLQTVLPVLLRVAGPGEINYNAQVIPAVRKIGVRFPIFVKYTRMLYNTPWIEKIAKDPKLSNYTLFTQDFFKTLGLIGKAKRKNDFLALQSSSNELRKLILHKLERLKTVHESSINVVEKYKSWQFGVYDERHNWQEVSWPWFIMASVTGLRSYLGTYKKYYSGDMPIGGIGYLNTRL
ncbi:MAG: bacillithiol biosynthesis protein BshC [Candidatus Heimdallarchaeaceae archaeon]